MKKNFTLIEMLVVIAIIAILASMLSPSLRRALGSATGLSCVNNLRQCGFTFTQYANSNKGIIPFERAVTGNPQWAAQFGANNLNDMPGHFYCPGTVRPKSISNTYGALGIAVGDKDCELAKYCNSPKINAKNEKDENINAISLTKMRATSLYPLLSDSVFFASTQYNDAGAQSYTISSPKSNNSGLHFRHVNKLNILFSDNHATGVEVGKFISSVITANGAVTPKWPINNRINDGWLRAEDYTINY